MRIPLSWLAEFVDLPPSLDDLTTMMDDLGLVVEGVEHVGEGLEDVIVARVDAIAPIEGADKIRLVTVDAGAGPIDIVCGAMNFEVGHHVPLAPVGAVLPGNFVIAQRKMRGVVSNGMLCSARELGLSDDHVGLMILDDLIDPVVGSGLMASLGIERDTILEISIEGNRPDAWSLLGVARDIATRTGTMVRPPRLATSTSTVETSTAARGVIDAPTLCGRLTVSVMRNITVGPSPLHLQRRLTMAGMRPISNVVDASNLVMLEMGQPTHAYDAATLGGRELRVRAARPGETLVTLDGVERALAQPGRGLGDAGLDCLIVDANDVIHGLAGVMGGAVGEISDATTEVIFEAAYFDPMTIARASKRHGLRSEASNRFERGVDPAGALDAVARFVALLSESNPNVEWLASPIDVVGEMPVRPTIDLTPDAIERTLGLRIDGHEVERILRGLQFDVTATEEGWQIRPSTARLDVRAGAMGQADVIEEIARLYSYARLPRRTPSWPQPGGLHQRQVLRRRVRDVLVDLGAHEAWTPTLGSDADFAATHPTQTRIRVTNPLASEESVLRPSLLAGLVTAWGRNEERGLGDVVLAEIGHVFTHPTDAASPRTTKGGNGGAISLALPSESERACVLLARAGDDARTAVATWRALAERLGVRDVSAVQESVVPTGLHPTRTAVLRHRPTGRTVGYVGEVDAPLMTQLTNVPPRRLGWIDIDLATLIDLAVDAAREPYVAVPSRYPSALLDFSFVADDGVHADYIVAALSGVAGVESVRLFDVYRGEQLPRGTRSLAFSIRLSNAERTLSDEDLQTAHARLIEAATACGATLRS